MDKGISYLMIYKVDNEKFTHCLRIAVIPERYEEERIERIKNYCVKYGVANVMLFINAEEFNLGHMTKQEAVPYVEIIKKAKSVFNAADISVSLNPWMSIGHLDRGRKLKKGQNFVTMTDMNGKKCDMVACPLDPEWKKNYFDFLSYLLKEISPVVIWIEDDFRLHNHGDLEYGGCFCEHHMKLYNQRLSKEYTREEFSALIFSKGKGDKERRAWLDISGETMSLLAEEIGFLVKTVSPQTSVGLMSSWPDPHCAEGRKWEQIEKGLFKNGINIHRVHLPCYIEINAKEYYYNFNCSSMVIRSFISDDALIYPEIENWAFSTYSKDSRFLRFQIESAIPLIISGMTYDIFDFTGNGAIEKFGYGEQIKEITPYLQAIMSLNIKFSDMQGVIVPVDENSSYNRKIKNTWRDLYPDEFQTGGYLSALGISYKLSKQKEFFNQTVFLFGGSVNNFTNEQLINLFRHNYIVLDGGAVMQLKEKNMLYLINAKNAELFKAETGVQSYELAAEGIEVCGIRDYRATAHRNAGDYVKINYQTEILVLSGLYSHDNKFVGNGAVKGQNFAVIPFVINQRCVEQFNELRKSNIYRILSDCRNPLSISDYSGVSSYLYKRGGGYVLILVNSTLNSFEKTLFSLSNIIFNKISVVDRQGNIVYPKYKHENGKVVVDCEFSLLCTRAILIN